MTEPREIARRLEPVAECVYHWRIRNVDLGGAVSASHAVVIDGRCVLIDPVGIEPEALAELPTPTDIVVTAKCHQRASWRYRRRFGATVWMPEGAPAADEEPDRRYRDGDILPGRLRAVHTPGPEPVHYALLFEHGDGILFCPDLVGNDETPELELVPARYQDDPEEARRSIERLLRLPFSVLCLDHGAPVTEDAKGALRCVLEPAPAAA